MTEQGPNTETSERFQTDLELNEINLATHNMDAVDRLQFLDELKRWRDDLVKHFANSTCDVCGREFKSPHGVSMHKTRAHGKKKWSRPKKSMTSQPIPRRKKPREEKNERLVKNLNTPTRKVYLTVVEHGKVTHFEIQSMLDTLFLIGKIVNEDERNLTDEVE